MSEQTQVPETIRELVESGWKPEQIAAEIHVSRVTIYRWKAGSHVPTANTAARVLPILQGLNRWEWVDA